MNVLIPISLGGVLGAVSRYYISILIQKASLSLFPFGTFVVNISGCLFIGFVMQLAMLKPWFPPALRLFLVTGFAGAYTTFSTFEYETCQLIMSQNYKLCFLNVLMSNLLGIISVFIGLTAAKILFSQGGF